MSTEFPFLDPTRLETFDAERVSLYVKQMLTEYPGLAENSNLRAYRQAAIDGMVLQLTSWCVSGRIPDSFETEVVEFPDGVWQTFKAMHMPYWFTSKYPVRKIRREIKKTVNHYFVCPHLHTTSQGEHIRFMATGTRVAGRMGNDFYR